MRWVLDADIRGFFDNIGHEWMMRFLQHEIADRRILHLIRKCDRTHPAPLAVFVHGGAWRSGSKQRMPLTGLVRDGFAVASADYRLTPVARFPAQIHDLKAAIRFLRAKQDDYGYDAQRLAIVGTSAGGHLAALVGVTNGHERLEGDVGEHLGESSDVQAIVSFFGAGNLLTILQQSTPRGLEYAFRRYNYKCWWAGSRKIGPELAGFASPLFHVDKTDPAPCSCSMGIRTRRCRSTNPTSCTGNIRSMACRFNSKWFKEPGMVERNLENTTMDGALVY